MPSTETKKSRLASSVGRQQLGAAEMRDVVDRLVHSSPRSAFSRRPSISQESSPASSRRALDDLALLALAARPRAPRPTRSRSTTATPSRVEHHDVARPDRRPADDDRDVELADDRPSSRRGSAPSAPRPAGRARRARSPSRTAASTRIAAAPRAFAWVASSSPTSATGAGSGIVSTSTSPGLQPRPSPRAPSGCRPGRSARSAPGRRPREPGTIWTQVGLDVARAGPPPRRPWRTPSRASSAVGVAHSCAHHLRHDALERLGVADRVVARARRAWLPRCSARCA